MSALLDTSAATRAAYLAIAETAIVEGDGARAREYRVRALELAPAAPLPVLPAMPADRKRAYRIAEARDRAAFEAAFAVPVEVPRAQ